MTGKPQIIIGAKIKNRSSTLNLDLCSLGSHYDPFVLEKAGVTNGLDFVC
jgi:hypothetical protein